MKALSVKMKHRMPSLGITGSLVSMSKGDVVIGINLFILGINLFIPGFFVFFSKFISLSVLFFRGKIHVQEYKFGQSE